MSDDIIRTQPIGSGGRSILRAHFGTVDYRQAPPPAPESENVAEYRANEAVWRDIISERIIVGQKIKLEAFDVLDWFPRAPGLYHTPDAPFAREAAFRHLHPRLMEGPVRDHAGRVGKLGSLGDFTAVFTPEGKLSMLEGGIGCVRLRPIKIENKYFWLKTATSDGTVHTGVPIALPQARYNEIYGRIRELGAVRADIFGELDFVDGLISRVFDAYERVPTVYLRVTDLRLCEPGPARSLSASVAVSFVSEYHGPPQVYATYVTFEPDRPDSFDDALGWMKEEYVEGEYGGRIITDFDQTKTIFKEAKLALSKILDRQISRGTLRETIELMHATGSVDAYFDAADRQELLRSGRNFRRTKIFISYAHAPEKDTKWVSRIQTQLSGLTHGLSVDVWADTRIEPGQRWKDEIDKAIRETKIAILVLTADFLASRFILESELPLLLEAARSEGAYILCVYGSAVHLSGIAASLKDYQFVNPPEQPLQALSDAEREAVFANLTAAIDRIVHHGENNSQSH
jgi:TIR domain